jgi:hypothetical protein
MLPPEPHPCFHGPGRIEVNLCSSVVVAARKIDEIGPDSAALDRKSLGQWRRRSSRCCTADGEGGLVVGGHGRDRPGRIEVNLWSPVAVEGDCEERGEDGEGDEGRGGARLARMPARRGQNIRDRGRDTVDQC